MKASNKSSIITGVALLILAALFSICLISQPFDFGVAGPGRNNIFYFMGNMLYTVYGFSSIFIPAFLLISGLSAFATKWTAKKTMRLITALVPFFTCVVTEKIIRSIVDLGGSFAGLKIIIALITGAMLIIIEYLGAGILADKIQSQHKGNPYTKLSKIQVPEENLSENLDENKADGKTYIKERSSIFDKVLAAVNTKKPADTIDDDAEDMEEIQDEEDYSDYNSSLAFDSDDDDEETNPYASYEEEIAAEEAENDNIFDDDSTAVPDENPASENSASEEENVFDAWTVDLDTQATAENATVENATEATPSATESAYDLANQMSADALATENAPTFDIPAEEEPSPEEDFDTDEDGYTLNKNTMISQEEFAALTRPDEPEAKVEDELVWPDLPPVPDKLPPEYDADFDENDPDLEFPPKDQVEEVEENAEAPEGEFLEEDDFSEVENSENQSHQPVRYQDSVVENPNFPHGIVIRDGTEEENCDDLDENAQKTGQNQPAKPKYPSKISLVESAEDAMEDDDDNSSENLVAKSSSEPEIDDDDYYVEDETLPFPEFDIESPDEQNDGFQVEEETNLQSFFNTVAPASTEKKIEDPYAAENRKKKLDLEKAPAGNLPTEGQSQSDGEQSVGQEKIFNQIAQAENNSDSKATISSAASDVFSDMEADIRKNMPHPQVSQTPEIDSMGHFTTENQNNLPDLEKPAATNLTADELSDFFNAQQEEMKPKGTEILANPPKITNQATKKGPYVIPSDLLTAYKDDEYWVIDEGTKKAAMSLKQTLAEFNIEAEIIGIKKGPVVTMFELLPAPGVKLSKIVALQDNIALSLAAQSVRIVAPIPGKQAVGIEVPNRHRSVVGFREIIEMDLPEWKKMAVPVILGKDILGKAQLIDLVKTPHMLIAGATGSGKSVCVNSLILSILYKRSFRDVKLILVDPKVVELKLYNNIPHLLTPVITEPKKALQALKWALCEMERRYALLDHMGVRDISNYNAKIKEQNIATEKLPYIVIIIDEFADLMATSGKELESVIARLTAMSRAVGIHLVLATQRPSVNVITGLIKANIPTRIAFMVASRTDSNIIIDTVGAEKLLGRGDMLYASAVDPAPVRIQGTFVSDQEVEDVVRAVKEYGEPDYLDDEIFIDDEDDEGSRDLFGQPMDDDDPLYDQALEIVVQAGKASASYIQRRLKIGYNRAARLVEEMEERGIVGPANGSKPREIVHLP